MAKKPRLTKAEKILKDARENPSPICHDPKQTDLFDYEKRQAFALLGVVVRAARPSDDEKGGE
jgi:hypothetical protein